MQLFRKLYLSDRFFLALGICSFLFFISYSVQVLIYPTVLLVTIIFIALISDLILLFRNDTVIAERKVSGVISLSDPNRVKITITNLRDLSFKIKVIDELPHQLNIRDFKVETKIDR